MRKKRSEIVQLGRFFMQQPLIENEKRGRSGRRKFPAAYRSTTSRGSYVTNDAWNVVVVVGGVDGVVVCRRRIFGPSLYCQRRRRTGSCALHVCVRNWRHTVGRQVTLSWRQTRDLAYLNFVHGPKRERQRENDVPLHLRARPVNRCTRSMQVNELSALPMLSFPAVDRRRCPGQLSVWNPLSAFDNPGQWTLLRVCFLRNAAPRFTRSRIRCLGITRRLNVYLHRY